jgi:hypothetical protein
MAMPQERDKRVCVAPKVGGIGGYFRNAEKRSEALQNLGLVLDAPLASGINRVLRYESGAQRCQITPMHATASLERSIMCDRARRCGFVARFSVMA